MREFREKRRKLKEARMSGKVSPGPQSLVLDGLTLTDIEGVCFFFNLFLRIFEPV